MMTKTKILVILKTLFIFKSK